MRIGQKAHIEHQIGISGNAVTVAKAYQRYHQRTIGPALETPHDELAKLVHVETGRVDDHVRQLANGLHQFAFAAQALPYRPVAPPGVRAARFTESPSQS